MKRRRTPPRGPSPAEQRVTELVREYRRLAGAAPAAAETIACYERLKRAVRVISR